MREEIIPYERLEQILCDYISNDAEATEISYIRETLQDICGCSNEEIIELGFGYLLNCEEEDEENE